MRFYKTSQRRFKEIHTFPILSRDLTNIKRYEGIVLSNMTLDNYEWRRLHERLDRAVADAALEYLRGLAIRRIRINTQKLSDELAELRLGREPDYDMPGLPLIYALEYMPTTS